MTTVTSPTNTPTTKKRKSVVPPGNITAEMSVFEYLRGCMPPLDKKIIDIACTQAGVPADLRDDAAQDIRIMWSGLKPDTSFKPGQIASYAHGMARHACLKTRRELGAAVRLPGSAFRKKADGTSYLTPGVLTAAVSWDDLEGWFQTDEGDSSGGSASQEGMSTIGLEYESEPIQEPSDASLKEQALDAEEKAVMAVRLEKLDENVNVLTARQYAIAKQLIEGDTTEEIMQNLGIKQGVLMRELNVVSSIIGTAENCE